jgi:Domain of unknown function (DUF4369)
MDLLSKTSLMIILRVIAIFLLAFLFSNLFAQGYTLNGKITGVDKGWAFVRHRQTGQVDSCRILNGNFTFSGTATTPEFCSFGLSANGVKDYYFSFFLENGDFTMRANKEALNDISISFTGSEVEKEFRHFQRQVDRINKRHYSEVRAGAELEKLTRVYTLKHPKSYVSAFVLISYENDLHELSRLYGRLAPEIQRSYYGKLIKEKIRHH